MPGLIVILVEPEKADNVGMIARAMKNFGFDRLRIVSPMFESFDRAIAASMRARDILEGAEILTTLDEARRDVDVLIGTTGAVSKYSYHRRAAPLREFVSSLSWDATYGVVMGRESVGLTNEELAMCDVVVTIPTSEEYPSINLANATAIVLYEFFLAFKDSTRFLEPPVPKSLREQIMEEVSLIVDLTDLPEHKREGVKQLVRRLLERTFPAGVSEGEATYLLGVLKRVRQGLAKRDGNGRVK